MRIVHFFHQLSQKMTTECPLILHIENMLTIHIFKKDCSGSRFLLQTLLTYSMFSDNLMSYFGLIDERKNRS